MNENKMNTDIDSNNTSDNQTQVINSNTNESAVVSENKTLQQTVNVQTKQSQDVENVTQPTIQEVTPNTNSNEVVIEFDTTKQKSDNKLLYIVIAILIVMVLFMDTILDLFKKDSFEFLNGITNEYSSNNLIDGFIRVNDKDSFIKFNKIKFYNFRQTSKGVITFNYVSDKNISKPSNLEIYIELYDSNQQLIYKELFNPKKIDSNVVSQYSVNVSNDVYNSIFYAKVLEYTKEEKNSTQKLKCTYTFETANMSLNYINTYNFINDELTSYNVIKSFTYKMENIETQEYKKIIEDEYKKLELYKIKNTYENNTLKYNIDLNNYSDGFVPLYEKGTIPYEIRKQETNKKWKCELI